MAMARAACTRPSVMPSSFSCAKEESCSTSSRPICATTVPRSRQSPRLRATYEPLRRLRVAGQQKSSALLRTSALSSAASWQGRLHLGLLTSLSGKARQVKRAGGRGAQASLLGVGAPEALVIGVVALLVFGPKGLAEVARTLGKSLRAFQPTIKELQQVSREFKATLEQEIGLDELRNPTSYDSPSTSTPAASTSQAQAPPAPPKQDDAPAQPKPYTTEDYVRITEEQAKALVSEEQRKAAEAAAWGGAPPVKPVAETPSEDQAETSPVDKASVPEQEDSKRVDTVGQSNDSVSPKL